MQFKTKSVFARWGIVKGEFTTRAEISIDVARTAKLAGKIINLADKSSRLQVRVRINTPHHNKT